MKRILYSLIILLTVVFLTACDELFQEDPVINPVVEIEDKANNNMLGMLSYISASFLDETIQYDNLDASKGLIQLSAFGIDELVKPDGSIELNLDQVNIYVDKLNDFIDHGTDGFGSVTELISDRNEFEYLIIIEVDEAIYDLYYNVDESTFEISGILIYDDVEYSIIAENSMLDTKDFDELTEEEKQYLTLIARNGSDSIAIEYEIKSEEGESKETFTLVSSIEGIGSNFTMEIKTDDNELVLTILIDEDEYIFKNDEEEEFDYKLDYVVNGVKGKVRILEKTNDEGILVYYYRVQEGSNKVEIELEDPDNDDE